MILGVRILARETRRFGNYPCQTVREALEFSSVSTDTIMTEGITVIKFTTNKSYCDTFSTERDIYW